LIDYVSFDLAPAFYSKAELRIFQKIFWILAHFCSFVFLFHGEQRTRLVFFFCHFGVYKLMSRRFFLLCATCVNEIPHPRKSFPPPFARISFLQIAISAQRVLEREKRKDLGCAQGFAA